ncbi:MAG: hypothetical protein ACW986_17690 [Promethearchaeota archaeon]|jgi:hypothetical protein
MVDVELKLEEGEWEGMYVDASGYRGKIELNLKVNEDEFEGDITIIVKESDEPCIAKGRVNGNVIKGNIVEFDLRFKDPKIKIKGYKAQLSGAKAYAQQAVYGIMREIPDSRFLGGTWIAWKFAKPKRE